MRNIEEFIAKSFKKKTEKSLKSATIIFTFTLIAITIYLAFIVNEQVQMNKNFYNNTNTHIIDITHKQTEQGIIELSVEDIKHIEKVLDKCNKKVCISNKYLINFGINTEDKSYYICSLDDEMYDKFGIDINNEISYCSGFSNDKNIELNIPIILEQIGGYTSDGCTKMNMKVSPMTEDMKRYLSPQNDEIYVSKQMYESIIEKMYQISYEQFLIDIENGKDFGIYPIERIWVYVNEFDDVKNIAKILEKDKYEVIYTLDAFDNLSQSLKTSKFIGFFILLIFLVITTCNMFISIEGYLRNSQKDMGILMHYGYKKSNIKNIYKYNFRNILLNTFLITSLLNVVIIFMLIKNAIVINLLIVLSVIIILLLLVYVLINIRLSHYVKKDVLLLLRFSKENE